METNTRSEYNENKHIRSAHVAMETSPRTRSTLILNYNSMRQHALAIYEQQHGNFLGRLPGAKTRSYLG